ncbi:hypothetical protein ACFOWZ_04475 [Lentzea rhizosphaerae]|uniref:Ig-like domain-containing protein n=1 Tax=Lentzea rhizosphaerae TaxID=2041025 RepID=A0ABV8BKS3_9PSEU
MNGRHRRRVVAGLLVLLTVQVGLVGPASAAVPGLEIAPPATSASNSSEFKSATASCPAGKVVVGTGARINGGGGDVVLDEVVPREGSVFVGAYEDEDGTTANWSVTAFAVCANRPSGYIITNAVSTTAVRFETELSATCPAGRRALGGGAQITGGLGEVSIDDVFPGETSSHTKGFADQTGNAGAWSITAFAICAFDPGGLQVVFPQNSSVPGSPTSSFEFQQCPAGKRLISTGWDFINSLGQVLITGSVPNTNATLVTVHEDDDGYNANWQVTTIAVCAFA